MLPEDRGVNGKPAHAPAEIALDGRAAPALMTALPRGPEGRVGERTAAVKFLEALRDRVVHRSQIGKRKLDRTATRRDLELALQRLGERYRALVRSGRGELPGELALLMDAVERLEQRLEEQDREIAELESEHPSRT